MFIGTINYSVVPDYHGPLHLIAPLPTPDSSPTAIARVQHETNLYQTYSRSSIESPDLLPVVAYQEYGATEVVVGYILCHNCCPQPSAPANAPWA
jgi:hypothetical protein